MPSKLETRTCYIKKTPEEAYEFFLKFDQTRKGQIITSISEKGPADKAGLKNGDRIIEINEENVENKEHEEIVNLIKKSMPKNEITLEVVGENEDPNTPPARTNGDVSGRKEKKALQPRLIVLKKKNNAFGFQLEDKGKDIPGHFIKDVVEGGAADMVGLQDEDRIIEINGTKVEKVSHKKVVSLMKQSGNQVKLLVVDDATYRHFVARKMKIKAKSASTSSEKEQPRPSKSSSKKGKSRAKASSSSVSSSASSTDDKARLVHVAKGSNQGFGFFLRVQKNEKGEVLGNVEPEKPAGRCGVMEDDRVLSVNGKAILLMSHEEVVDLIKSNPNHGVFLVGGPKAIENAKNNGLLSVVKDPKKHILEKPRHVKLNKGDDGYGFYLKIAKNKRPLHIVTEIADDSPAAKEGLQEGEVVACVGENDVTRMSHEDCVQKIREAGDNVDLTVGSYDTFETLYDLKVPINEELLQNWPEANALDVPDFSEHNNFFKVVAALAAVSEVVAEAVHQEPQEPDDDLIKCTVKKIDDAFGFFLHDENGHFLGKIEEGGPADLAGIKDGDQIIKVNGVDMTKENHDEVVQRITSSGSEVTFSVRRAPRKSTTEVPAESEASASAPVSKQEDEVEKPPLPRLCEINRLASGYGFHLNSVDDEERPGKYLTKVAKDGAADIAGVHEGDRLIEVNDQTIEGKTHEEVVGLIRQYASKVTVFVVDEETDRYYKKKGIAITKALLVTVLVSEHRDSHSNASSIVEAEATVHVDPEEDEEEEEKETKAEISFPPPPTYEEKNDNDAEKEEEEKQDDSLDQEREEQVLEELQEIAEEIKEAVAEEDTEEVKEDVIEEIADEIADDIAEKVAEDLAEDIAEQIAEKVTENLPEALAEDIKEEIQENISEEIQEEIKEDIKEAIEDDVREIVEDEVQEVLEDDNDRISDELKVAAAVAVINEIPDSDESQSEAEETKEEVTENVADYKQQLEREMREQMEREMREKLEKEMREKMEEEMREKMAASAASTIPEPPAVPSAVVFNAIKEESKPKSPVKKSSQVRFVPKVDSSVKVEDIAFAARNLRSIKKKVDEAQPKAAESTEVEKEVKAFRPAFMSARSMFEGGQRQELSNQKPAWQRPSNSIIKRDEPTIAPPAQSKPQASRQTSWNKSGISFKIVETSAAFN